jgi:hypothetical protein
MRDIAETDWHFGMIISLGTSTEMFLHSFIGGWTSKDAVISIQQSYRSLSDVGGTRLTRVQVHGGDQSKRNENGNMPGGLNMPP